jgi:uncharacterized membrane protein YfcA
MDAYIRGAVAGFLPGSPVPMYWVSQDQILTVVAVYVGIAMMFGVYIGWKMRDYKIRVAWDDLIRQNRD